jgi:hypothetical protein
MKTFCLKFSLTGLVLLTACAKEPPPISTAEMMENPRLLEATMVRCSQNRSETKYLVECVNARDAVNRLEAGKKEANRADFEAQSERKRQALRRTQEAAAEARRRAQEAERLREQAEYLGVTEGEVVDGSVLADDTGATMAAPTGTQSNAPGVEIAPPEPETTEDAGVEMGPDGGVGSDLEAIREELKRRQEEEPQ